MRYPGWIKKFNNDFRMNKEIRGNFIYKFDKKRKFKEFPELESFPNFKQIEKQVSEFWSNKSILTKYLGLNKDKSEYFSFFDGPITANNPMGVHHAWGRTIKDITLRYQTFLGKKFRYQNGFDCQGLWLEVEVEKNLKLQSKKQIIDFGLENFANACKSRVQTHGELLAKQSLQLSQFMDWDNSYWTHTDKNIEHIWFFLKECDKRRWLYKGHKIMPWCPRCETSLSQHEQADSYKELVHPSIFVTFKVVKYSSSLSKLANGRQIELLVWTTTPWTLPANTAVAVNPDEEYLFLESNNRQSLLVISKTSKDNLRWLENWKTVDKLKGKDLIGNTVESLSLWLYERSYAELVTKYGRLVYITKTILGFALAIF